ncbi:MAG: TonB-dependent receptor, partial [Gammaproteobacteria bacterium]|nr:TonB-dependent receptor [Gammaproteobacteria bacterium]
FKRETAYTKLGFDLTSDTTVFVSANYGHFAFRGQGAPPTSIGPIVIGVDNPYLPASIRDQMVANSLPTITLGKVFSTVGANYSNQANDTWRVAAGAAGKIFGDWNWSGHAAYGQTREDYRFNGIYVANILAAADAVAGPNGAATCAPLAGNPNLDPNLMTQVQAGCVPFNIFGVSSPATNPAAYRYMFQVINSVQRISQASAGVNLNGSPVSDWAGPVELGVGLDYRHDLLNVASDPIGAAGYYLTSGQANYSGSNYVKEGYAELGIPLARNAAPFVKAIDLNLAARFTDYQIEGAVWTHKFGLTYDINDTWRLRATRSRDIRAPTLYDLYSRQPPSLDVVSNPFTGTTDTERYVTAGNLNLRSETADSTTAGIVFSSDSFRASLDYFHIRIRDLILPATAGTQQTVDGCYAGNHDLCSNILFNSDHTVNTIFLKAVNGSSLLSDGLDFESIYRARRLPFGIPGALDLRMLASFSNHQSITSSGSTTNYSGSGGLFIDTPEPSGGGIPKWRGTFTISYVVGPVTTQVQVTGFSPLRYSPFNVGPGQPGYAPNASNSISRNVFPGEVYVNPTITYDTETNSGVNLQVYGVVNNLMDRAPPQYALNAFSDNGANYYDVIGRTFALGLRLKW